MITILCGKSASGKDTLLNELVKSGEFESLISTTSRPMRDGETDGKEYHFVSREEFEKRLAEGKFIEHRSYNTLVGGNPDTWYYGMEKRDLDPNKNYLVILDLEGAKAFQQVYGKDNTLAVFVEAPDAIRTDRAMSRGSFDESEWKRRLADDNIKFSEENVFKVCDTNVLNYGSDLGKLVRDFKNTFEREMLKKYLMSNDVYIGVTMGKTGFEDCFTTDMNPDKGGNIRYFKQYPDSIRVGDYEYEDGTVAISMPDNEELFKEVKDRVTGYYGEDNIYTLFLNDFEVAQGWGDHSVLKDECLAKQLGTFTHFVEKHGMNIEGLSEKSLLTLMENGVIKELSDLFRLSEADRLAYTSIEGLGDKAFDNLLASIERAKTTDTEHFLYACGIEGISKGQIKEIVGYLKENYNGSLKDYQSSDGSYDLLGVLVGMEESGFDFTRINGIGDVLAKNLSDFIERELIEPEYGKGFHDCLQYLTFKDKPLEQNKDLSLTGKTFVITGTLNGFANRDELVSVIEANGGKVSGSVSKNTDYLINNDVNSTSGKNKKAQDLGVPIISEADFVAMVENPPTIQTFTKSDVQKEIPKQQEIKW